MTGKELIEYIQKNNLFDETIIVVNNEGDNDSLRISEYGNLVIDSCYYE